MARKAQAVTVAGCQRQALAVCRVNEKRHHGHADGRLAPNDLRVSCAAPSQSASERSEQAPSAVPAATASRAC